MLETIDHGQVRELRLARPPVNALDPALVGALHGALAAAIEARSHVVVLSGRPGIFSAGLDVPALLQLDRNAIAGFWRQFFGLQQAIATSPVPVIAAITGHCPAGGTVITLYCDHRVMAEGDFRIGLNEVQVGLYAGELIYRAFERLMGTRLAASCLARGALLSPGEALRAGLVDEVVQPEQVVPRALAIARELAQLPQHALAKTRALVRRDLAALFATPLEAGIAEANEVWFAPQTQERLGALFPPRKS